MKILKLSLSAAALDGYGATLFDCQDNNRTLCVRDSARIYFVTFEIYILMTVYQNNLD